MIYVDLDEWSRREGALNQLDRSPYALLSWPESELVRGPGRELSERVRQQVQRVAGRTPEGPIRVLSQLRYFGRYFSPLNVIYCFDAAGETVEFVVAEVNNTPWGEQHHYVLWEGNVLREGNRGGSAGLLQFEHPKDFHVSPFMQMDVRYRWRLCEPGESLYVGIENTDESGALFEATMAMRRQPLNERTLSRSLRRRPWMTSKIVAAIYWQALKLWWKKCPLYSHPKKVLAPANA